MKKIITWRYDFDFSKDTVDEAVEGILKDFQWAKEQPETIEVNIVNFGWVVAERLITEGLPIKKMVKLKRGWADA